MKLYLIRHGQTDENLKNIINDNPLRIVPLNKKGISQATKAAKLLADKSIELIYTSQFVRTKETAKIISSIIKVKVVEDVRLRERKSGFDGKQSKQWHKAADKDFFNFKPKNGETFQDEKERTKSFIDELKQKKFNSIVVVSHEEPLQTMLVYLKNMSDKEAFDFKIENCQIIEIDL